MIGPMSGMSVSRGSHRRMATTSCRRLSRLSGRSQPGALMKSEMTNISERRLIPCSPAEMSGLRADIRSIRAGGDVPVNVANVIFGLVLAQTGEIHAEAIKQGAVIALKLAIQAADDLPVEALQNALRRRRR